MDWMECSRGSRTEPLILSPHVYLDRPSPLRLERRLTRDVVERGRTPESVWEQFWKTVAPIHDLYVAPQARWTDIILTEPPSELEIQQLIHTEAWIEATR